MSKYIIKLTENCNLRCGYCMVPEDLREKNVKREVLEKFVKEALEVSRNSKKVEFGYQGGEPLLFGPDNFVWLLGKIEEYKQSNQEVRHLLQTNGTLLNDEWADIIKHNKVQVGFSLDGTELVHNKNRCYVNGEGSYNQTIEGIKRIQKIGNNVGVIAVITKSSLSQEKEILSNYEKESIKNIRLNPYSPSKDKDCSKFVVSNEELFTFYKNIYDLWVNDFEDMHIEPLYGILESFFTNSPNVCSFGNFCSKGFVTLQSNGDVYPCARYVGSQEFKLGNIKDENLVDMLKNEIFTILDRGDLEDCKNCKFLKICNGGCSSISYFSRDSTNVKTPFCETYKNLFEYMLKDINERL